MKNTTLARKPKEEMKKNSGTSHEPRRRDQAGDGKDFAFNGQMGDGVNRSSETHRWSGNHSGLSMKENYGSGPRHGNKSDSGDERGIGKSVTKDPHKKTIATASEGHNVGKHEGHKGFKNPDAINVGMKG
jgi:hypothetical protein